MRKQTINARSPLDHLQPDEHNQRPTVATPDSLIWMKDDVADRDELHGPAFVTPRSIVFYRRGSFHRSRGPAVITSDGFADWFVNGMYRRSGKVSPRIFEKLLRQALQDAGVDDFGALAPAP